MMPLVTDRAIVLALALVDAMVAGKAIQATLLPVDRGFPFGQSCGSEFGTGTQRVERSWAQYTTEIAGLLRVM